MTNHRKSPLRGVDDRLRASARATHVQILRSLCLVHHDQEFSRLAFPLLRGDADYDGLLALADYLSAQKYTDAWTHYQANQFSLLIRKYPFFSDEVKNRPKEAAIRAFFTSEFKNHRMNQRFRARRHVTRRSAPYEFELDSMRRFIAYVIGDEPPLSRVLNEVGFGPGAAIGVHGNATNVARKLASNWSVTSGAYTLAYSAVMGHAQVREILFPNPGGFTSGQGDDYDPFKGPFRQKVSVVAYNKIAFVPKTAKTHRAIAVEPLLNSFLQKGIDVVMRQRLKRIGIDLSCQEKNSEFAREGSLPGQEDPYVTIDLAAASDSISIELVRDVLPPAWFDLLNSCRSKFFLSDGVTHRYEKFCSMGNGFCFPLETLLFVAACHASGATRPGRDYLVYGDDIIVRQSVSEKLIKLLAYLGFRTNSDKTFIEGPFRESCGKDWFGGIDVRPYTLNYRLNSLQSYFKFLNGTSSSEFRKRFFDGIRPHVLRRVPDNYRFFRPFTGPEDTGINATQDEFLTSPNCSYRFRNGSGAWRWKELITEAVADRLPPGEVSACALVYAALVGSASNAPFALRRKTKTKVRFISHPGATSLWLPSPDRMV